MEDLFLFLKQMYDEVLLGLPLAKDSHSYAVLLDPLVPSRRLSAETSESRMEKHPSSFDGPCTGDASTLDSLPLERKSEPGATENVNYRRETTLLQLTLIEMVLTNVRHPGMEARTKQKYLDVVRILLKEASIDLKLVFLLRTSDQLVSHMACKSLVLLVHFQLREEGSLNSSWLAFCSETLSAFPSSCWTAECLWTLTNTVREILKDESLAAGGGLAKLFSPLDGILEGFYRLILSQAPDLPEGAPASAKCTNALSSFLDLLELLVASRSRTAASFACQRMLFSNTAYVLGLTASPVPGFIKKKSVVLLKRCILCKAGEDLVTGKASPSSHRDPHLDEDRCVFSSAVLQFVNSGWLNRLSVGEKIAHFGGSRVRPNLDICRGPDEVFLRALSLVLLKALEIRVRKSTSEREAQVLLESVMCPLLSFLKDHLRSSPCVRPFVHPCTWLSKLFIEQDDDMFEAAKALLSIHLQLKRFGLEDAFPPCLSADQTQDASAHRNGSNPHCVFFFLLQSIAFDSTVLLDFLISSETCFLEYLVRYLKLLIEDWRHFANASEGLKPMTSGDPSFSLKDPSCQEKDGCQSRQFDDRAVKPDKSSCLRGSDNTSSPGGVQRLVVYESSEDSEIEEECLADRTQTPSNIQACSDVSASTGVLAETSEPVASPPDHGDLTALPPSQRQVSPGDPILAEGTLRKMVVCLRALRESISRLHRRNLFPYNPAALLKLLTRVDAIGGACSSSPSPQSLETHQA
uniref:protein Lines homolog 1 n=1 Tax=Euleptes europaea TaxID=460621 RepID=UPI00253FC32D|nr:protein Lines homolog 1 [Euleptes europaea]